MIRYPMSVIVRYRVEDLMLRRDLVADVIDRLHRKLFQQELATWQAALALHDDWDMRSHAWHLPEIIPARITEISTHQDYALTRQNDILITAERDHPTVVCHRKAPWA